jgi:hypothetical protein
MMITIEMSSKNGITLKKNPPEVNTLFASGKKEVISIKLIIMIKSLFL